MGTSPTEALAALRDTVEAAKHRPSSKFTGVVFSIEHAGVLLAIAEAAAALYDEMLPHDYDPHWSALGAALASLTSEETPTDRAGEVDAAARRVGRGERPAGHSGAPDALDTSPALTSEETPAKPTLGERYLAALECVGASEQVMEIARNAVATVEGAKAAAAASEESSDAS